MMEHMFESRASVNLRNFKQYLLFQRLRRESEILTLKTSLHKILKAWRKARSHYSKYPVLSHNKSPFPQLLLQSFLTALGQPEFEQWVVS